MASTPLEYFPTVILADEFVFADVSAADLRTAGPHVRVLILGPAPLDTYKIRELLLKGAMGYVPEDSPPVTIRKAIRSLARNEIWASRAVLSQVIMELRKEQLPQLTAREGDVLSGLRRGLSNRLIASELGISHETVRWHLRRIYAKIGVHDRKQTV